MLLPFGHLCISLLCSQRRIKCNFQKVFSNLFSHRKLHVKLSRKVHDIKKSIFLVIITLNFAYLIFILYHVLEFFSVIFNSIFTFYLHIFHKLKFQAFRNSSQKLQFMDCHGNSRSYPSVDKKRNTECFQALVYNVTQILLNFFI